MNRIRFEILGVPQPKQSARFSGRIIGKKVSIHSYQKSSVVQKGKDMAWDIQSQIPEGFIPFDGPIGISGCYIFPPLSKFSKKKTQQIADGWKYYKATKPDLHDNLNKQLMDVMEGLVFTNDSRICRVEQFEKYYGMVPKTIIEVFELEDGTPPFKGISETKISIEAINVS